MRSQADAREQRARLHKRTIQKSAKLCARAVLVGAFLMVGTVAPIPQAAAAPRGTLHGHVTDATTGQAIPDAIVTVVGAVNWAGQSDGSGHYSIKVPPGNYTVGASKTGYTDLERRTTVRRNATTTANFALVAQAKFLSPPPVAVTLSADFSQQAQLIGDKFSDINYWGIGGGWMNGEASSLPSNFFSGRYPWIKRNQFMFATGGCYSGYAGCGAARDLFIDPSNRNNLTDYDFTALLNVLRIVVNQGLTPMIITGNIPIKYSASPHVGTFGINDQGPSDYMVYYDYMKALGNAVVATFGINTVMTWSWGVFVEANNPGWLSYSQASGDSAEVTFFKIYDYTAKALQDSIGGQNLSIGVHFDPSPGLWAPQDFIAHVASGTNYATGGTGAQLNRIGISLYCDTPNTCPLNSSIVRQLQPGYSDLVTLRNFAQSKGLTSLQYGVDEGHVLNGTDGKYLVNSLTTLSWQGAYDANLFRDMVRNNIDYFSNWTPNTLAFWDSRQVDSVSSNLYQLTHKMANDKVVATRLNGTPLGQGDIVNGVVGYDASTNTAHVLIYNLNYPSANTSEPTDVVLNNIARVSGSRVTVTEYLVDDNHANFWPRWAEDRASQGIGPSAYVGSCGSVGGCSMDSTQQSIALTSQSAISYWFSQVPTYQVLARLAPATTTLQITNNTLTLSRTIAPHGVVFYEITNVKLK